nr:unnamed protein product [Callosobruchus chinensis]
MTAQRSSIGQFQKLYDELRAYSENFFKYYRMSLASFDELLQQIVTTSYKLQRYQFSESHYCS